MRILLVADGRSPITHNWISMLSGLDHEIHLISTFPHEAIPEIAGSWTIPVGFSIFAGGQVKGKSTSRRSIIRRMMSTFRPLLMKLRAVLAPLTLSAAQDRFLSCVREIQPDIVHALRVPFEGMLASALQAEIPLIVSIWGNDLTLHAYASRLMGARTRQTLERADGLIADAERDIVLAKEYGLREGVPELVVPGSGGLDLARIKNYTNNSENVLKAYDMPLDKSIVINPRGFRPGSVHQDVFFDSIPYIVKRYPNAHFVCPGMCGQPLAEKWIRRLDIEGSVTLLPFMPQEELWALYSYADIYVSLSSHDGTPNSFLEAISRGCFPVVGDITSLREWIEDGVNGSLVDPHNVMDAADAVVSALRNDQLRKKAGVENLKVIKKRADMHLVSQSVRDFYGQFARNSS